MRFAVPWHRILLGQDKEAASSSPELAEECASDTYLAGAAFPLSSASLLCKDPILTAGRVSRLASSRERGAELACLLVQIGPSLECLKVTVANVCRLTQAGFNLAISGTGAVKRGPGLWPVSNYPGFLLW